MSITPAVYTPNTIATMTTIPEARQAVVLSQVAIYHARETENRDLYITAWEAYVFAHRKVTELIDAQLRAGEEPELSFTPMQWSRRLKLLAVPDDVIEDYFDAALNPGFEPSVNGLYRYSAQEPEERDMTQAFITRLLSSARALVGKLPPAQDAAIKAMLQAFDKK